MKLAAKSDTLDHLSEQLRQHYHLDYDFIIMHIDKDFNNELVSLTHMSELDNLSSIRLVGIENVSVEAESANCLQEGNSAPVPLPVSSMRKSTGWPEVFQVPQFEHVELLLQRGNIEYAKIKSC